MSSIDFGAQLKLFYQILPTIKIICFSSLDELESLRTPEKNILQKLFIEL